MGDEMLKDALHSTLEDFYRTTIFKQYERNNYKSCIAAFETYCVNTYPDYSLKELFESAVCLNDIVQAGKLYFETSKRVKSIEAINRFLSAMDFLYKNHINKMKIYCACMEDGCRHTEIIRRIIEALDKEIKKGIYLPITEYQEKLINALADNLSDKKFYPYGQKIIYNLMVTYGLKTNVILEMPVDAVDINEKMLLIKNNGYDAIQLYISDELTSMFERYMEMQIYKERKYMFTNIKGKQLKAYAVFDSLQNKINKAGMTNVSSTPIALRGIEKMLNRGLLISEIVRVTGFSVDKIADVAEYMTIDSDISDSINRKIKT